MGYHVFRRFAKSIKSKMKRPEDAHDREGRFIENGRRPWSTGYLEYQQCFITDAINDPDALNVFRDGSPCPLGFGIGIDERCIEYPWVLSRLPSHACRILDVSSRAGFECRECSGENRRRSKDP